MKLPRRVYGSRIVRMADGGTITMTVLGNWFIYPPEREFLTKVEDLLDTYEKERDAHIAAEVQP